MRPVTLDANAQDANAEDAIAGLPHSLLDFWFGPPGAPERRQQRDIWWRKDPAFDDTLRRLFGPAQAEAAAGRLARLAETPEGALALVILLDQIPRNIFRGDPRCYACDGLACATAADAIARGFDRNLSAVERMFLYMPFEHSERLADQDRAVELFAALERYPETAKIGETIGRHREIVARFGRFPHRNALLGRASTAEEEAFLKEPNSSF
jgi:uncharacterized protein (DUF924 family)